MCLLPGRCFLVLVWMLGFLICLGKYPDQESVSQLFHSHCRVFKADSRSAHANIDQSQDHKRFLTFLFTSDPVSNVKCGWTFGHLTAGQVFFCALCTLPSFNSGRGVTLLHKFPTQVFVAIARFFSTIHLVARKCLICHFLLCIICIVD